MFHLFFVNDNYYYFFRLHQLLCERLLKMYQQSLRLIEQEHGSHRNRPPSVASVLRLSNRRKLIFFSTKRKSLHFCFVLANTPVDEYYSIFLDMVRSLLDGNMDSSSYEDSLREMFGIHAYIAFTMDKIIHNSVRQVCKI
jgi:paired amphipathic helix protein Sin3a